MRISRILSGTVTVVLLALTPLAAAGAAQAAQAERALPKRTIGSTIEDTGNKLVFRGNVSPGHANKRVFIQKKNCKGERCDWHRFDVVRTNDKGGFHRRVPAPRDGYWYWRAKVKAHGGYGTSYSDVWRTFVI